MCFRGKLLRATKPSKANLLPVELVTSYSWSEIHGGVRAPMAHCICLAIVEGTYPLPLAATATSEDKAEGA